MALPSLKRISRSDLKDAPGWIDGLIVPLNSFMDTVFSLLNGRLTFQENFRSTIRAARITTPATYSSGDFDETRFLTGLPVKATGVLLLQITADDGAAITAATSIDWIERNGEIRVRHVAGLADSTKYSATFLVF